MSYNNAEVTLEKLGDLRDFAGFNDLAASATNVPVLRTGKFAVNSKVQTTRYIVTVPKIYDGSMHTIKKHPDSAIDRVLIMNRPFSNVGAMTWRSHLDWCEGSTSQQAPESGCTVQ